MLKSSIGAKIPFSRSMVHRWLDIWGLFGSDDVMIHSLIVSARAYVRNTTSYCRHLCSVRDYVCMRHPLYDVLLKTLPYVVFVSGQNFFSRITKYSSVGLVLSRRIPTHSCGAPPLVTPYFPYLPLSGLFVILLYPFLGLVQQ